MPIDGSVQFTQLTGAYGVLVLAGPKSREILQRVSDADFRNEAFRWLTAQDIRIGMAPVNAMRVNYVGELGWELHHPIEYQNHIFDALFEAGAEFGLKPFGIRAMDSMRLEKSYRMVGTELSIEYSAYESAMDRFVKADKGDFLGREALLRSKRDGLKNLLVTIEVADVDDADALGNNALSKDGEIIGRATGGGYGFQDSEVTCPRYGRTAICTARYEPRYRDSGQELCGDCRGGESVRPEKRASERCQRSKCLIQPAAAFAEGSATKCMARCDRLSIATVHSVVRPAAISSRLAHAIPNI